MTNYQPPKIDFSNIDLIDQEIKELKELGMKLVKYKEVLPEKEYNKMFHAEAKIIHKKYKQIRKENRKKQL